MAQRDFCYQRSTLLKYSDEMNTSKTKLIWIGRKTFLKEKINTNCKLEWGATDFSF